MDAIRINGGVPLNGEIVIGGAKNAALPLMAASLLSDQPLTLVNMPELVDITTMGNLLRQHGVHISQEAFGAGRAAVEAYFLKTMDHVDSFQTQVDDVARSGGNFYVRWTMDVRFKGAKEPVRTIGVTLLRFDRDGRAVLHQDFWDPAAGFYEHLPVLGGVMRWIKSKI